MELSQKILSDITVFNKYAKYIRRLVDGKLGKNLRAKHGYAHSQVSSNKGRNQEGV